MATDPSVLDDLLMRASRSLRRQWATALAPLDMTPHHARALRVVAELGRPRVGLVADRLRITPRSATEVVDALQDRSLVSRVADEVDRRAICVTLTDHGRFVLGEVDEARRALGERHFGRLTPSERDDLGRLLGKIDDLEVRPAPAPRG